MHPIRIRSAERPTRGSYGDDTHYPEPAAKREVVERSRERSASDPELRRLTGSRRRSEDDLGGGSEIAQRLQHPAVAVHRGPPAGRKEGAARGCDGAAEG